MRRGSSAWIGLLLLGSATWLSRQSPAAQEVYDTRPAEAILAEARAKAKKDGKNVFVVIGATWCKPCKNFWRDIHSPPFGPVIDTSYILVQLHGYEKEPKTYENKGTVELANKWSRNQISGIPFYAVLSPEGKLLETCMDGREGHMNNNIGIVAGAGDKLIQVLRKTGKAKKSDYDALQKWVDRPFSFDGG
jgi:hypothetical protein